MNGTLSPGSKLKTRTLSTRFDVGLSPIREALSRLSSEGWVVQSDRRGFSVVPVSVDELWDLHNARCMLNEMGLRSSIELGDTEWEERILLCCIRIVRQPRPSDMTAGPDAERWNRLHRAFHESLVLACRSQRVIQYCNQLFDEIERYRRIGGHLPRNGIGDEHQKIADAAVSRDSDLAVSLLNAHFARTVELVEGVILEMTK